MIFRPPQCTAFLIPAAACVLLWMAAQAVLRPGDAPPHRDPPPAPPNCSLALTLKSEGGRLGHTMIEQVWAFCSIQNWEEEGAASWKSHVKISNPTPVLPQRHTPTTCQKIMFLCQTQKRARKNRKMAEAFIYLFLNCRLPSTTSRDGSGWAWVPLLVILWGNQIIIFLSAVPLPSADWRPKGGHPRRQLLLRRVGRPRGQPRRLPRGDLQGLGLQQRVQVWRFFFVRKSSPGCSLPDPGAEGGSSLPCRSSSLRELIELAAAKNPGSPADAPMRITGEWGHKNCPSFLF